MVQHFALVAVVQRYMFSLLFYSFRKYVNHSVVFGAVVRQYVIPSVTRVAVLRTYLFQSVVCSAIFRVHRVSPVVVLGAYVMQPVPHFAAVSTG